MSKGQQNTLVRVLDLCRPVFWIVFAFSFGVNLLMLVSPLYSLQVLDRVFQNLDKVCGRVILVPAYWDCLCSKTEKNRVRSGFKARNAQENPKFVFRYRS